MATSDLRDIFGDRADALRDTVIKSVRETHDRHAAAQATINPKSQLAYGGSIWAELPNNLCSAVQSAFLDATTKRYPRSRYSIPVLNDCVLYVWRPRGGQSPDEAAFFTSSLREDLFEFDTVTSPTLFDVPAPAPAISELELLVDEAISEQRQVVLIAVTARAERLHTVEWGLVSRGMDLDLNWISRETIFTYDEEKARPTRMVTHTFADGQPPAALVMPRIEAFQDR